MRGIVMGGGVMETMNEFARTIRRLLRSPGFTGGTTLTLAMAIGASAAVFNLVNAVILEPLSFDPDGRLVRVWDGGNVDAVGLRAFAQARTLESVSGFANQDLTLVTQDRAERVLGAAVTSEHFSFVGARVRLGRSLIPSDLAPGAAPVVVLSQGLWERAFAGDPEIVGRSVRLTRGAVTSRTVVGVLSAEHRDIGYRSVEAWVPLTEELATDPSASDLFLTARLAPGVSADDASLEIATIAATLQRENPRLNGTDAVGRARVVPLIHFFVQEHTRRSLWLLLGGVLLVFLVACGNVTNLVLARAADRRDEMRVRSALGCGRAGVVRLMMMEAGLVGALGGLLGIIGAGATQSVLLRYLASAGLPRLQDIALGADVLLFTACLSIAAALTVGAVSAARVAHSLSLEQAGARPGGRTAPPARARVHRGLVVAQVALTVPVLACAGLMMRSSFELARVDPGFKSDGLMTARILPQLPTDAPARASLTVIAAALDRIRAGAGIADAEVTNCLPMGRCSGWSFYYGDHERVDDTTRDRGFLRLITPGYLGTQGIPVIQGRGLSPEDGEGTELVLAISESMASELFGGAPAVGRGVRLASDGPLRTVVGVVGDVLHRGLDRETRPTAYVPITQWSGAVGPVASPYVVVRHTTEPALALTSLRAAIRGTDATMPIVEVATMTDVVRERSVEGRALASFINAFGLIVLLLSLTGVYSVSANAARAQRRNMGIRVAIGAEPTGLAVRATWAGLRPVVLGVLLGLALTPIAGTALQAFLFGVRGVDAATYLAVAMVIVIPAITASAIPAARVAAKPPSGILKAPT